MSTSNRSALHAELEAEIRRFIAAAVLTNQRIADEAGLQLSDMQGLGLLQMLGEATPGALAATTGLTTGGVTVMLDRLERQGFVRRVPNPRDRRSVLIRPNVRKLRRLHALYAGISARLEALMQDTPEAELQSAARFFARVNTAQWG